MYKPLKAIWKGSHNPILRDWLTTVMIMNHLQSWDDPPSTNPVQATVGNKECDYSEDAVAASVVL